MPALAGGAKGADPEVPEREPLRGAGGGSIIRRMLAVLCRLVLVFLVAMGLLVACGAEDELLLGATTSVQDNGLLDELVAAFEEDGGYRVKPIVQGSGQVTALARRGELDVIMTHSPAEEERFIDDGYGLERTPVMQNFFLMAGPRDDPADVAGAASLAGAFQQIAESRSAFVSRGDGSGTHARELATWEKAGIDPDGEGWYRESAAGQGLSAFVANDGDAYTLIDSATFAALEERLQIVELFRDASGPNVYSVIRLNAERLDKVNEEAADAWVEFITSEQAQRLIAEFGRDEFGGSLFQPLLLDQVRLWT